MNSHNMTSHFNMIGRLDERLSADAIEERFALRRVLTSELSRPNTDNYVHYETYDNNRRIGHVMLARHGDTLAWCSFFPFGEPVDGPFYPQYQGRGIGTYVHARLVHELATSEFGANLTHVDHASANDDRRKHLRAMGLPIHEERSSPSAIPFPLYHERSLWYAQSRGFEPSRWKPIVEKR